MANGPLRWQDVRAALLFLLGGGLLVFDLVFNTPGEVKPVPASIYGALLGIELVIRGTSGDKKPTPPPNSTEAALEAALKALAGKNGP